MVLFEIALYLCTMHLSLIWYFASAHGIPAFERKLMFALANIELRAKNGDGDSMRTERPRPAGPKGQGPQGCRPEGPMPAANKRKQMFALANIELQA